MERAGDDAPVEHADRQRRRHVRAAVVDGDDPERRVGEQHVEVAEGHPPHRAGRQVGGGNGRRERRVGGAGGAELGRVGEQVGTTAYQQEMAQRLHLPYEVLSDAEFRLTEALGLPTFEADGMRLLKRLTLLIRDERIETCFYPVFPPDADAEHVLAWLHERAA